MTPDAALLTLALAALAALPVCAVIAYRLGRNHHCTDNCPANRALREVQAQMMRGAAVMRHKRPNPHKWSDPELEVVRTESGGLAFTDAEWSRARARYDAIKPELPLRS